MICSTVVFAMWATCAVAASERSLQSGAGYFVGFGFGAGSASWDWVPSGLGEGDATSGTVHFRGGMALRDDLLVGLEGAVWANRWDASDVAGMPLGEITLRLAVATVAVTYFPGNVGIGLKGGLGLGGAFPELGETVDTFRPDSETGFAALGSIEYDWKVTDALAIAPAFHISYLAISGDWFDGPMIMDGSVNLNWYW